MISYLVKIMLRLGALFAFFALVVMFLFYGEWGIYTPHILPDKKYFLVRKGDNLHTIADRLVRGNFVAHVIPVYVAAVWTGHKGRIKAGEYAFSGSIRPVDIVNSMGKGEFAYRYITIPEGYSIKQIITLLDHTPFLSGQIESAPPEGSLLPETYAYIYGENRQKILNRMKIAMDHFLVSVQESLINHPYIHTPHELLTLASLVEKETGIAQERPLIAGVFLNRLKLGMPLQCDPTVIYGITYGEKLERSLTRQDLKMDTPFNTYTRKGLPKGPIACPGRSAILAVLYPQVSNYLYFVASGTGGHRFAENLNDHNKNVALWRKGAR